MKLKLEYFCKQLNLPSEIFQRDFTEEDISRAFGDSLKRLRNHKKLSLNALSEIVDVPNPTINRYENGINIPTITQALKLSEFFNVPIEIMILFGLASLHTDIPVEKNIVEYLDDNL